MQILENYEQDVLALLGSIQSHRVVTSKESSKVIRDLSKQIESKGVELRKSLVALDKTLVANHG